jgi:drug/metabolite transporter (DMT)-like permease
VSLTALALVLGSAVLHATWNLFAKRAGGSTRGAPFVLAFSLLTAILWAPLVISQGGWSVAGVSTAGWLAIVGSAVIHVGYFLALQRGYRVGDLSLVYPLARGGGPLIATLGAIALFGERPSGLALIGTLCVAVATAILASGRSPGGRSLAPGLVWGGITALFIGSYTLWDARAVAMVGVPPLIFLWWSEWIRALLIAPLALRHPGEVLRVWREQRAAVIAIATLSPAAYLMVLNAYTIAPVTLVAPTREASVLIGSLFGIALLGEGQRNRRLVAAAVMVVGVGLLARG